MGKSNDVKKIKKKILLYSDLCLEFRIVSPKLSNKCECLQLLISVSPLVLTTVESRGWVLHLLVQP